jgi:hypothetical protein
MNEYIVAAYQGAGFAPKPQDLLHCQRLTAALHLTRFSRVPLLQLPGRGRGAGARTIHLRGKIALHFRRHLFDQRRISQLIANGIENRPLERHPIDADTIRASAAVQERAAGVRVLIRDDVVGAAHLAIERIGPRNLDRGKWVLEFDHSGFSDRNGCESVSGSNRRESGIRVDVR